MSTFTRKSGADNQAAGHDAAATVTTPTESGLDANPTSNTATRRSSELVRSISQHDARVAYETKEEDEGLPVNHHGSEHGGGGDSSGTDTSDEKVVVAWKPDDPENPYNFSTVSVSVAARGTTGATRLTKHFMLFRKKRLPSS